MSVWCVHSQHSSKYHTFSFRNITAPQCRHRTTPEKLPFSIIIIAISSLQQVCESYLPFPNGRSHWMVAAVGKLANANSSPTHSGELVLKASKKLHRNRIKKRKLLYNPQTNKNWKAHKKAVNYVHYWKYVRNNILCRRIGFRLAGFVTPYCYNSFLLPQAIPRNWSSLSPCNA